MITCSWKLSAQHSTYSTTCQLNNQNKLSISNCNFNLQFQYSVLGVIYKSHHLFLYSDVKKILNSYQTRWVVNNCRAIKVHRCEFLTSLWGQRKMSAKMYHMSNADAGVVSSLQSHSLYTKWRTFRARGGGALPYKRLMGMCRWMGSHCHDWIDYIGVPFSIELIYRFSHS